MKDKIEFTVCRASYTYFSIRALDTILAIVTGRVSRLVGDVKRGEKEEKIDWYKRIHFFSQMQRCTWKIADATSFLLQVESYIDRE